LHASSSRFSVEAIIRFEPELRAVRSCASRTTSTGKIVALNEKARQMGVEAGATKSQLEAWEDLVLRARSELQETSAHAALLDCAQSLSPEVEDTASGTVLLNLAGLEPGLARCQRLPVSLRAAPREWNWKRMSPSPQSRRRRARRAWLPGSDSDFRRTRSGTPRRSAVDVLLESFSSMRTILRAGWRCSIAGDP